MHSNGPTPCCQLAGIQPHACRLVQTGTLTQRFTASRYVKTGSARWKALEEHMLVLETFCAILMGVPHIHPWPLHHHMPLLDQQTAQTMCFIPHMPPMHPVNALEHKWHNRNAKPSTVAVDQSFASCFALDVHLRWDAAILTPLDKWLGAMPEQCTTHG